MVRTVCTELQCLYNTAKTQPPLWAVQPIQGHRARKVHLYFYHTYGLTACTETQCLYSTAQPLIPYVLYILYRASVPINYIQNSKYPMGCTFYTQIQSLYSTVKLYTPTGFTFSTQHQCLYSKAKLLYPL